MRVRPKRIFVTGALRSGKSYLADRFSKMTGIEHYDLDDIVFAHKFDKVRSISSRKRMLDRIAKKDSWIIAGADHSFVDSAIRRSQLIIIVKEWFPRETLRLIRRSISRLSSKNPSKKETLGDVLEMMRWNYNAYHGPEGLRAIFLSELKQKHGHKVIILKSKKEVKTFLEQFE